jgi:hypothetical protein
MQDFTSSRAFRVVGPTALPRPASCDLMIYDASAHLPIYGLEDLGFVGRGESGTFIAERNTSPGGELPLNTNGGGLSTSVLGLPEIRWMPCISSAPPTLPIYLS